MIDDFPPLQGPRKSTRGLENISGSNENNCQSNILKKNRCFLFIYLFFLILVFNIRLGLLFNYIFVLLLKIN